MKLGIFGGSFNPIHNGHLNSLNSLREKMPLDRLFVVPTGQNPLVLPTGGATSKQRWEMVQIALRGLPIDIDPFEIQKGGLSFTIDTLNQYHKSYKNWDIYLIIGLDQFLCFHQWKDYREILTKSHLIVTSRPGNEFPEEISDLPNEWQSLIQSYSKDKIQLTTGRSITFHPLDDMDISSTEIRRNMRKGWPVAEMVPPEVLDYMNTNQLYEPIESHISDFKGLTESAAQVLIDKNAIRVKAYDMTHLQHPTEFNLIASGNSTRHTKALSEYIVHGLKEKFNIYPQGTDGQLESQWIVLDYGSLMVHLFYDFTRWKYRLEDLWYQGKDMELNNK